MGRNLSFAFRKLYQSHGFAIEPKYQFKLWRKGPDLLKRIKVCKSGELVMKVNCQILLANCQIQLGEYVCSDDTSMLWFNLSWQVSTTQHKHGFARL